MTTPDKVYVIVELIEDLYYEEGGYGLKHYIINKLSSAYIDKQEAQDTLAKLGNRYKIIEVPLHFYL